jgi:GT2 family glycosyltransferase
MAIRTAKNPKISVVITGYKDLSLMKQLLAKLLETKYRSFEIVLIDDASPVDLRPLKKLFPQIHYFRNKVNMGVAQARTVGVAKAKGEIILSLDNDVKPLSDIIHEVYLYFKKNPSAVAVTGFPGTGAENPAFFAKYKYLRDWAYWNLENDKNSFYYFRPAIGALKKAVFMELGGYDDRFNRPGVPAVEDLEFSYRLAKKGRIVYDSKLIVGHPFGGLRKLIDTYFKRSQLFLEIFSEKRALSGVATTGGEVLTLGFALLSLLTLILSVFIRPILPVFVLCFGWFIFQQRKFLAFAHKKEGLLFAVGSFLTSWLLYLVIFSGAVFAAVILITKAIIRMPIGKRGS